MPNKTNFSRAFVLVLDSLGIGFTSDAVKFGDITDPESEVSKAKALSHDYSLLKMLNTKPRTTYLAKLRNPHPDLVEHKGHKDHYEGGHH